MKFSSNGYYVEKYDKCSVCGKLVYENKRIEQLNINGVFSFFCSEWCVDWEKVKEKKKKQTQYSLV